MYHVFKNVFDFFISALFILLLSPLFIVLSLCVFFVLKENPFFVQQRIGFSEIKFTIVKFKTMNSKTNEISLFSSFMRRTGLDEIPQLINVLKGDMSLVGPRPLLPQYLTLYTREQAQRHLVKPGITGLSQIAGGNALSWNERLGLDVQYVKKINLMLDLKIIFKTVLFVLFKKHKTPSISEDFKG